MRKELTGILLFFSSFGVLFAFINNFDHAKTFYSLWNPDKYFVSDTLIYDRTEDSDSDMSSPLTYYYGVLQENKTKGRVLSKNGGFIDSKVPVKYCILSKAILYDSDNKLGKPLSYESLNELLNTFLAFIWLPNLLYFIYLKSSRVRLKITLLALIGVYFVFFVYEIVTDFIIVKSIYSIVKPTIST